VQTTDDAKPEPKPEPTIWAVPDDVWEIIEEILSREYPRHRRNRAARSRMFSLTV